MPDTADKDGNRAGGGMLQLSDSDSAHFGNDDIYQGCKHDSNIFKELNDLDIEKPSASVIDQVGDGFLDDLQFDDTHDEQSRSRK